MYVLYFVDTHGDHRVITFSQICYNFFVGRINRIVTFQNGPHLVLGRCLLSLVEQLKLSNFSLLKLRGLVFND